MIERPNLSKGFTLVELMVALMVTAIVLAAVAALAYACGSANDAADDTSYKQAQLRYATMRLSELIKNSRLVCAVHGDDVLLWKADDNPANGKIDVTELVYIEATSQRNCVKILEFSSCPVWIQLLFDGQPFQINALQSSYNVWKALFSAQCGIVRTTLIKECANVQFFTHSVAAPQTRRVSIFFDLTSGGTTARYQISSSIRGWAGNLLTSSGWGITGDDD